MNLNKENVRKKLSDIRNETKRLAELKVRIIQEYGLQLQEKQANKTAYLKGFYESYHSKLANRMERRASTKNGWNKKNDDREFQIANELWRRMIVLQK